MFTKKTYLDKSKIDGIGVFAGEFIPQGEVIWKFVDGFDDAKYTNHSSTPNMLAVDKPITLETFSTTTRDIQIGEEITEDYTTLMSWRKLNLENEGIHFIYNVFL